MKVILLLAVLAVARGYEGASKPLLPMRRHSITKKYFNICSARVAPYPLNGKNIQQVNDTTDHEARSSYWNFSLHFGEGKIVPSELSIAVEYKDPILEIKQRRVQVKWNNLLFTASLSILQRDHNCSITKNTFFGYVELVQTDTAWHKNGDTVNECREKNLATNKDLQYVLTKLTPHSRYIFANDTAWGRVMVRPRNIDYMVPLKYESSEIIVIDYEKYPDTVEYERLIKKKIFLVEISKYAEVLKVIAGVDVTMYIDCVYDITTVTKDGHITVNKSHSLIQRISDPQKYVDIIENSTQSIRDRKLSYNGQFQNPGLHTLNPLIHIHTQ